MIKRELFRFPIYFMDNVFTNAYPLHMAQGMKRFFMQSSCYIFFTDLLACKRKRKRICWSWRLKIFRISGRNYILVDELIVFSVKALWYSPMRLFFWPNVFNIETLTPGIRFWLTVILIQILVLKRYFSFGYWMWQDLKKNQLIIIYQWIWRHYFVNINLICELCLIYSLPRWFKQATW